MLLAWAQGDDTDGLGDALPGSLVWQARLWRALREAIGGPSPAELLVTACERVRAEPGLLDLPTRLSVFGPTRLSPGRLSLLGAIAAGREVHLWLPHPSAALLWAALAPVSVAAAQESSGPLLRAARRPVPAAAGSPGSPLLASLGRDSRELQQLLAALPGERTDEHLPGGGPPPGTVLGHLQQALVADRPPAAPADRPLLDQADRSLRVHACHGRSRQVDVLRDVVLGLMAADPTLEPRDVLVMCPDIEAYAPLVTAAFAVGAEPDPGVPPWPTRRTTSRSGWPTARCCVPTRCSSWPPRCSSSPTPG